MKIVSFESLEAARCRSIRQMPGLKQKQPRDVNNNITAKELQPWTKALYKKYYLVRSAFWLLKSMCFILEKYCIFFSIIQTCGLDKSSRCCFKKKKKQKNTQHGETTENQEVFWVCLFLVHILLLWLAYGKPNWEIIMLEYFKGMPLKMLTSLFRQ